VTSSCGVFGPRDRLRRILSRNLLITKVEDTWVNLVQIAENWQIRFQYNAIAGLVSISNKKTILHLNMYLRVSYSGNGLDR
jgi:hypothetical protein